jgi:hypothetical protein
MQRVRSNTVTHDLPILVPCNREEQDGVATFAFELSPHPESIRVVTAADFQRNGRGLKEAIGTMWDDEREQFRAVLRLMTGIQRRDELEMAEARRHVAQILALRNAGDKKLGITPVREDDLEFGRNLIKVFGLGPGQEKEAIQRWCGYRLGPYAEADDKWLLSQLVSGSLSSVRLVLWWSGSQFRPALYCPEAKSAVYTFLLMKIVAGRGWGVCPYCGDFFIQSRADQSYCTVAHREAHRVKRWRAAKVSRAKKEGGTPNGPRKTR